MIYCPKGHLGVITVHKLIVKYEMHFEGPWHIGSGQDRGLVDSAVILQRIPLDNGKVEYRPVIPGSTVKGRLRTACEDIAVLLGLDVIDPHDDGPGSLPAFTPHKSSGYIVNRLFGSRFAGECLFVSDAVWQGEYHDQLNRQPRTGVSLDRLTGTAKPKHLFHIETVLGGTLVGSIEAFHHAEDLMAESGFPSEYALLLLGLQSLKQLGGKRSIGWGQFSTRIMSVTYNDQPVEEEIWRNPEVLALIENWDGGAK